MQRCMIFACFVLFAFGKKAGNCCCVIVQKLIIGNSMLSHFEYNGFPSECFCYYLLFLTLLLI